MKRKNKNVQDQVEKTLAMFSEKEKLKASPDFYARLRYEMHRRESAKHPLFYYFGAILRPAAAAFILLLNIYTGYAVINGEDKAQKYDADNIASFASEYMLADNETDWLQFTTGEGE